MDTARITDPFLVVLLLLTPFACIFLFQRMRYRRNERLGRNHRGFAPGSASLGNALQTIQLLTRPTIHYVLEEKLNEDTENEADGAPPEPGDTRVPRCEG